MGYMSIWNMESMCHVYESMKDNITYIYRHLRQAWMCSAGMSKYSLELVEFTPTG